MYEGIKKFEERHKDSYIKTDRIIMFEVSYNGGLHCCFSDYVNKSDTSERVWFDFTLIDIDNKDFGCVDFKVINKPIDELIEKHYANEINLWFRTMSIDYLSKIEKFYTNYDEAVERAKEIYYDYNQPFANYDVIQYFDNCFDGYIKKDISKREAIRIRNEYTQKTNRYAVSFGIKVHPYK